MKTITRLLDKLETCYDAIPRVHGAAQEQVGPFVLFIQDGPGWPYYARPGLGTTTVAPADVDSVLERQRQLGLPEAIEWVDEVTPSLLPAAESLGLSVLRAPLMVLDPAALPDPGALTDATLRLLDPNDPSFAADLAASSAVARVGFGAAGTAVGTAGPSERDAMVAPSDPAVTQRAADAITAGLRADAVAATPAEGILASGGFQAAAGAAEVVGVATLPSARRRGLGAAISALLARQAIDAGEEIVFLSAADADVARVYARIGFRRVGTACILNSALPNSDLPNSAH